MSRGMRVEGDERREASGRRGDPRVPFIYLAPRHVPVRATARMTSERHKNPLRNGCPSLDQSRNGSANTPHIASGALAQRHRRGFQILQFGQGAGPLNASPPSLTDDTRPRLQRPEPANIIFRRALSDIRSRPHSSESEMTR